MPRLLVCVAGMPGSGKGVVTRAARSLGIPVFTMGDVVREEASRRGLPHTPENLNRVAVSLREEEGAGAVAQRMLGRVAGVRDVAVIDGVRSLDEIRVFRQAAERIVIVAVHASPRTRYKRLLSRRRAGDPKNWEEFVERDMVELGFGLGSVIALADYMIVNESTLEEAEEQATRILVGLVGHG